MDITSHSWRSLSPGQSICFDDVPHSLLAGDAAHILPENKFTMRLRIIPVSQVHKSDKNLCTIFVTCRRITVFSVSRFNCLVCTLIQAGILLNLNICCNLLTFCMKKAWCHWKPWKFVSFLIFLYTVYALLYYQYLTIFIYRAGVLSLSMYGVVP